MLRCARETTQSRSATSAWMRSSSAIVRGSRRPKPHSVAMEKFAAYFFAVARRRFVPVDAVGVMDEAQAKLGFGP